MSVLMNTYCIYYTVSSGEDGDVESTATTGTGAAKVLPSLATNSPSSSPSKSPQKRQTGDSPAKVTIIVIIIKYVLNISL